MNFDAIPGGECDAFPKQAFQAQSMMSTLNIRNRLSDMNFKAVPGGECSAFPKQAFQAQSMMCAKYKEQVI